MEGDLLPALEFTVENDDGTAVNLTGMSAVFLMAAIDENGDWVNEITAAATIPTPSAGLLRYQWVSGDTDARGKYVANFMVTDGTGRTFSAPNDDFVAVFLLPRIQAVAASVTVSPSQATAVAAGHDATLEIL